MSGKKKTLTPKEKLFCKYYTSQEFFCNWTKSYMKSNPSSSYESARVQASKLLTNNNIIEHIGKLLDWLEINDNIADRELSKLVLQDEDKWVKLNALKHYDNLRARIEKAKQKALDNKEISKDVLHNEAVIKLINEVL